MENLQQGFAILKWWTSQKPTDKLLVFLVIVNIILATSLVNVLGTNGTLQEKNLTRTNECEQRVASSNNWIRNRYDSLRAQDNRDCELEKQAIYGRAPILEKRNQNIEKELKK